MPRDVFEEMERAGSNDGFWSSDDDMEDMPDDDDMPNFDTYTRPHGRQQGGY